MPDVREIARMARELPREGLIGAVGNALQFADEPEKVLRSLCYQIQAEHRMMREKVNGVS